jgi:hypothetical protein
MDFIQREEENQEPVKLNSVGLKKKTKQQEGGLK